MDRDELLDQDDYLYVPDHSIPGISADFLNSISVWLEMTSDSIVDAVDTLDKPAPHVAHRHTLYRKHWKRNSYLPLLQMQLVFSREASKSCRIMQEKEHSMQQI